MQVPDPIVITDELRSSVTRLQQRVGEPRVLIERGWEHFADRCGLASDRQSPTDARVIAVGTPAFILKSAAATTDEFGFIVPVAQSAKPWQRATSWRDDTTLRLWDAGWSPTAIDRLLVATHDAILEFVVGNARRTPVITNPSETSTS